MRDHGLSPGQFATALVLWSVTGFVLEVPSGALADRVDRRLLLFVSAALFVGTMVVWLTVSTFAGFVVGFVLWGASTALESGTFEALLYDELTARGAAQAYARVRARSETVAVVAMGLAIASASPLYALGGYRLVGLVTVVVAIAHLASVALLPRAIRAADVDEPPAGRYVDTLRSGVAEAVTAPLVRRAIVAYLLVILLVGVDEYAPNLLSDDGIPVAVVPWVVAAMVAAEAVGTALSGVLVHVRAAWVSGAVGAAGPLLVGAGALLGGPATMVGVIAGYGFALALMRAMETRVQEAITGPSRATVTSVAGVANELASITSFAVFGAAAAGWGWSRGVGVVGLALVLPVALAAWRSRPPMVSTALARGDGMGPPPGTRAGDQA